MRRTGLRNPAPGGEEEAGPPHSSPCASAAVAPSRLTAEGRETQGPRRAAIVSEEAACPCPRLTSESEPSPSMLAFCQVSSTAGSKQAEGAGQGLVGGSLRRPESLDSEPEGELVSQTRPADRRGA